MIIRILINTPPGQAEATANNLKHYILGAKTPMAAYGNEEKGEALLEVECNVKDYVRIRKNIEDYDKIVKALRMKIPKKTIMGLTKSDDATYNKVIDSMNENTHLEIVKNATAEELLKDEQGIFYKIKNHIAKTILKEVSSEK